MSEKQLEPQIKIGDRVIGENSPPFIIAEIGINHGGNLDIAKHMVELVAKSGGECVKHQTHFVEDEMTEEAKTIYPPNANCSIWEVIENCSLAPEQEIKLKEFTEELGLIFLSTPFSRKAANFLNEIGVDAFKIGSGEANNIPLIRHISRFQKPIIMSTGMQRISDLQNSVGVLRKANIDFALLECTNLYPSAPSQVSLGGIKELKAAFSDAVIGFSDHSIGSEMALSSIALGASIVERHFTDTRYREGPDISCSMEPSELRWLIDRSKKYTRPNPKERTEKEENVYAFARIIVADRDIPKGAVITEYDIWARRPGNGEISAHLLIV